MHLPYNLHYTDMVNGSFIDSTQFIQPSSGAWNRKISKYASFAEYSESPYEADGVSDTGVTLRAFLPFGTAQDRENLESYEGKATVLDARVTCQVPQFQNATISWDGDSFQGSLTPTRNTPRLANATFGIGSSDGSSETMDIHPDRSRDFDCFINWNFWDGPSTDVPTKPEWRIALCQLWKSNDKYAEKNLGGLVSEFFDPSRMEEASVYAKPYLILNNTLNNYPYTMGEIGVANSSHERGEWLDMSYWDGSAIISASVCYAAFDFADIDVRISSQSNRTESRLEPVFDRETSAYTFTELRNAMGQDRSLSIDERSILELEKRQWQAVPQENYTEYTALTWLLRSTADLGFMKAQYMDATITNISANINAFSPTYTCAGCVEMEYMHVSTFPGYETATYLCSVPLVALKSLQEIQIVRYSMAHFENILSCHNLFTSKFIP
jgi:hypothetical protein